MFSIINVEIKTSNHKNLSTYLSVYISNAMILLRSLGQTIDFSCIEIVIGSRKDITTPLTLTFYYNATAVSILESYDIYNIETLVGTVKI